MSELHQVAPCVDGQPVAGKGMLKPNTIYNVLTKTDAQGRQIVSQIEMGANAVLATDSNGRPQILLTVDAGEGVVLAAASVQHNGPTWVCAGTHMGLSGPPVGCFTVSALSPRPDTTEIILSCADAQSGEWQDYFSTITPPMWMEVSGPNGTNVFRVGAINDGPGNARTFVFEGYGAGCELEWLLEPHQIRFYQ